MNTFRTLLAVVALGSSLAPAFADEGGSNAPTIVAPIVEGRQATPIATPALTSADQLIIDRNAPNTH